MSNKFVSGHACVYIKYLLSHINTKSDSLGQFGPLSTEEGHYGWPIGKGKLTHVQVKGNNIKDFSDGPCGLVLFIFGLSNHLHTYNIVE